MSESRYQLETYKLSLKLHYLETLKYVYTYK
jgi:hypothetical protein